MKEPKTVWDWIIPSLIIIIFLLIAFIVGSPMVTKEKYYGYEACIVNISGVETWNCTQDDRGIRAPDMPQLYYNLMWRLR